MKKWLLTSVPCLMAAWLMASPAHAFDEEASGVFSSVTIQEMNGAKKTLNCAKGMFTYVADAPGYSNTVGICRNAGGKVQWVTASEKGMPSLIGSQCIEKMHPAQGSFQCRKQRELKSVVFNGTHGTVPWNKNEPIPVWVGK